MATTRYTVFTTDTEGNRSEVGTKSKKAQAVELAQATRDETGLRASVETGTGNEVFAVEAPRKINMSPRYTRTVEVPEGLEVPEGSVLRYARPRRNAGVLHFPEAEKGEQWAVIDLTTGRVLKDRFATTRDAGQRMNDGVGKGKVEAPEAEAEQAEATPEPANA